MSVSIERLGPGDEATLELLAREDADFDLDGRRDSLPPLEQAWLSATGRTPACCTGLPCKMAS